MFIAWDNVPLSVVEFMVPIDRHPSLFYTLRQADGVDCFRHRLAPFAPGFAERMNFTCSQGVFQPEFDRVQFQFTSDIFHVTLHRPEALRYAVAAVCP